MVVEISNIFAGLIGAGLALIGSFIIQNKTLKKDHQKYLAQLVSKYLAIGGELLFTFAHEEGVLSRQELLAQETNRKKILSNFSSIGSEIGLVAPKKIVMSTSHLMGELQQLMLLNAMDNTSHEYYLLLKQHGENRLGLQMQIRKYIKSGKMSEAELGYDSIDTSNLKNPYNPEND